MRIKSQQKYINRYIKEMQAKYLNKEKLFLLFIFLEKKSIISVRV